MFITTLSGTKRALGLLLVMFTLAFGLTMGGRASAANDPGGDTTPVVSVSFSECNNKYDGKAYHLSKDADKTKFKNFQKDACDATNGGYCVATASQEQVDGGKSTVEKINCTKDGGLNGGGGGNNNGDGITDPALTQGGCTGANCSIIDKYINPLIKLLSAAVGIVAVIFIIFGGIQISTSAGDPQKVASGRNHIRNAIIGLVAYVLLALFLNWVVIGGIGA
jgi:hypothetical protein